MNRREFLKKFSYVPLIAVAPVTYFLPPRGGWPAMQPYLTWSDTNVKWPFSEFKPSPLAGCHYDSFKYFADVVIDYNGDRLRGRWLQSTGDGVWVPESAEHALECRVL